MNEKVAKAKRLIQTKLTTTRLVVIGFALIILFGALLLTLPFSSKSGESVGFLGALFTAASATCVTGLTVFNVINTFTFFGQFIIILLIQVGGLGFMTITSALYVLIGKKMSLRNRLTIKEDLQRRDFVDLKQLVLRVIKLAAIAEGTGAIILTVCFCGDYSFFPALWRGIFHSVSAFCNAGFDIIELGNGSMAPYYDNPVVLLTVSILIIVGGLGFMTVSELTTKRRHRLSLHSRIVLLMTTVLLAIGTIGIIAAEYNNPSTMSGMSFWQKLCNGFFHSASTRTAGFYSFSMPDMTMEGKFITMVLMFIGASPGSTGGGLKTTTLFVLIASTITTVQSKKETVVDMQVIDRQTISKAGTTLFLALAVMTLSMLILSATETASFSNLLFEQISAYATVGLTAGVTPSLSVVGQIVIIINMFLGRVGVLSFLITFAATSSTESKIQYANAHVRL